MPWTYQTTLLTTLLCLALPVDSQAAEQDNSAQVSRGQKYQLVYLGGKKLPNFDIDGKPAQIHTQGIYLTSHSLYVTGRLERNSRRALLLRFERSNLKLLEYLDITPSANTEGSGADGLDHPGGFDYDGTCFWIPVAVSAPHSSTVIVKISTKLDSPLSKTSTEVAFVVDDHIGAIACDPLQNHLYGANWDTKLIYVWHPDGTRLKRIPRAELIENQPHWSLAVQDWKGLGKGILLASGVDKSPLLKPSQSKAVIQWIDLTNHQTLDTIRLPRPFPAAQRPTREGMTVFKNQLFLLPGDLGKDAILHRYQIESATEPN